MSRYQMLRFIHLKLTNFRSLKLLSFLALFGIIFFINAASIYSAEVTLKWEQNSEPDMAGYRIYIGYSSGNYQFWADAGNNTSIVFTNAEEEETYFFVVTAYDIYGNESEFSDELIITVPVLVNASEPVNAPEPQSGEQVLAPSASPEPEAPTPSPYTNRSISR